MARDTRRNYTDNFRPVEFDCHDGTEVPLALTGAFVVLCEWWLEPLRDRFGPVQVVSGFRTVTHNALVGGVPHSIHLGKQKMRNLSLRSHLASVAADVVPETGGPNDWAVWARGHRTKIAHLQGHGRGGVGLYVAQGFVHLDTGPLRDWRG